MQKLHVNDLPFSEELSSSTMTAASGGRMKIPTGPKPPALPQMLDPIGPYGINGFVLPEGAFD
jgi:hypothetical protein